MPEMLPPGPRSFARRAIPALLLFAAAGSAFAIDTVDLQVRPPAKVRGTIRDSAERESFVLDLAAGTKVTVVVKAKSKGGTLLELDLVDESLNVVATGTAKGKATSIKGFTIQQSGRYRARVQGDGVKDGDYEIKISVKPQGRWVGTGESLAASQADYVFSAPADATAKITVKAAKGSGFVPSLTGLEGPNGFFLPLMGGGTAGPITLGDAGDYGVNFDDAGTGGTWTVSVVVTPKKFKPSSVDISARALGGSFAAATQVFGREIGPEGGDLDPDDLGLSLDGASLSIPSGALSVPSVLTISEGTPFFVGAGVSPTGPAVKFSPNGTQFSQAATVTIPFDPTQYNDAAAEMTIYVQDDVTGEIQAVPKPYDFSGPPGTVSFPASHFSTYLTTNTAPRGVTGDWVYTSIGATNRSGFEGKVVATSGVVNFTGGLFYGFLQGVGSRWSQPGGTGTAEVSFESQPSDGAIETMDATTVELAYNNGDYRVFQRGYGDDLLITSSTRSDTQQQTPDNYVEIGLLARATRAPASDTNVPGKFSFVLFTLGAESDDQGGNVRLTTQALRGSATFLSTGRVTFTPDSKSREGQSPYPLGLSTTKPDTKSQPALWTTDFGDLTVTLGNDPDDPDAEEFSLRPIMGGGGFVGVVGRPFGISSTAGIMLMFREASALARTSDINGTNPLAAFDVNFEDRQGPDPQGFEFNTLGAVVIRATGGGTLANGLIYTSRHDQTGEPTFGQMSQPTETVTTTIRPAGRFDAADGSFGIISPRGDALVGLAAVGGGFRLFVELPSTRPGSATVKR